MVCSTMQTHTNGKAMRTPSMFLNPLYKHLLKQLCQAIPARKKRRHLVLHSLPILAPPRAFKLSVAWSLIHRTCAGLNLIILLSPPLRPATLWMVLTRWTTKTFSRIFLTWKITLLTMRAPRVVLATSRMSGSLAKNLMLGLNSSGDNEKKKIGGERSARNGSAEDP